MTVNGFVRPDTSGIPQTTGMRSPESSRVLCPPETHLRCPALDYASDE